MKTAGDEMESPLLTKEGVAQPRKPDRAQPQEMARRGGRSHCDFSV